MYCYLHTVAAQEGPGRVIAYPGQDVELLCNVTGSGVAAWKINGLTYLLNDLFAGQRVGHSIIGNNIIVKDIINNDFRSGSRYVCVIPQPPPRPNIESDPAILIVNYVSSHGEYTHTLLCS